MYMLGVRTKIDRILNIKPKIGSQVNLGNSVVLATCFPD